MHLLCVGFIFSAVFVKFAASLHANTEHFECDPNGEYIPFDWRCDGMDDCSNSLDEENCDTFSRCTAHEWECADKLMCVDNGMLCNSHNDCSDGSDESTTLCATYAPYCPMNTMKCGNDSGCVSIKKRCDGVRDCPNGYDELYCSLGRACDPVDDFTCKHGDECIHLSWVCDSKQDCADGSDEDKVMCSSRMTTPRRPSTIGIIAGGLCDDGIHSRCGATGHCINTSLVCDGTEHCPDGSDESPLCEHACQGNGGCGHICHPTPEGPRCSCRQGFLLTSGTKHCKDINECDRVPPLCSQHCINTQGSFICSCDSGYTLEKNGRFCKANEGRPDIVYVEGFQIKHLQYYNHLKHIGIKVSEKKWEQITAFDIDAKTDNIYWTSTRVNYVHVTGPSENKTIMHGINHCAGLAIDWISRNIYYIDFDQKVIRVCGMNTTRMGECFTAVQNLKEQPNSLALDPTVGLMFWCDDGQSPRIESAYMTGRQRSIIVKDDLARPSALTLDLSQRRIYWVDSHYSRIESVDYSGNLRIRVLESPQLHAYGVNLFEDFLYWSDTEGLYQAHKFYTNDSTDIIKLVGIDLRPGTVKAMHKLAQPTVTNLCSKKKPQCSHYCLLTPVGAECLCPDFMRQESTQLYNCVGVDCQNGGKPVIIDFANKEIQCSCPVGFGGAKCDNKTGVMFTYPLLAKNNYAWVAGVLCVLVLSIASIVFGIYCCRRKRNEKEIISIIKFRQAAAKTQNAMMDPSMRSKSESTQILVEQSAFENPAYHQEEDENANNEKGTLVVMSTSDESIDSAFLSRQDSVENDLSIRPLTISENYDSS